MLCEMYVRPFLFITTLSEYLEFLRRADRRERSREIAEQDLVKTDKIQPILVTTTDLLTLVRENVLVETSAMNCVALAMLQGHLRT